MSFNLLSPSTVGSFAVTNTRFTGEDALANLSIEKEGEDGPITGFVRIRSRSQGLALSLGSLKGLNKIGTGA